MNIFEKIIKRYPDADIWALGNENAPADEEEICKFNEKVLKDKGTRCSDLKNLSPASYGFSANEFFIYAEKLENEDARLTSVKAWEKIVVLIEDGSWAEICTYFYRGWCKNENLSLANNVYEWENFKDPENFIVVTEYGSLSAKGKKFSLGTILPYSEYNPQMKQYKILLPAPNGKFCEICDYIEEKYVHKGFLKFTPGNILRLAYSALGKPYTWGGLDCSGFIMDIFRCFGFKFPRDSDAQKNLPFKKYDVKNLSPQKKIILLKSLTPGSILGFTGHIMLYLGEKDGDFYVINAVSSLRLPDNSPVSPKGVIINPLSFKRMNSLTWLEEIEFILDINYLES